MGLENIILSEFIYMVYYIDRLSYIEPSLHLWDKAYLVMVDNVFDVFLESVCQYFIEYFCIYTAEKNNDVMKFAGKWMELENVILSEQYESGFYTDFTDIETKD
ncbi:hypothetical protein STEG23_000459, partial [Scotinomys teguina]